MSKKKVGRLDLEERDEPEFKLYKRLFIALGDIFLARHFAHFIDTNDLHYKPWQKRQSTQIQQAAYTIALIVSYCRPFTKSIGLPMLGIEFRDYSARQEKLHNKILKLRHQVHAHSDSEKYGVKPFKLGDYSSAIESRPPFMLTKHDIKQLKSMMKKLEKKLSEKHDILQMHFAEINESLDS